MEVSLNTPDRLEPEVPSVLYSSSASHENLHTEKSIVNLVNLNQIRIAITLIQFIQHQTNFRLVLNQSGECNQNPNLV